MSRKWTLDFEGTFPCWCSVGDASWWCDLPALLGELYENYGQKVPGEEWSLWRPSHRNCQGEQDRLDQSAYENFPDAEGLLMRAPPLRPPYLYAPSEEDEGETDVIGPELVARWVVCDPLDSGVQQGTPALFYLSQGTVGYWQPCAARIDGAGEVHVEFANLTVAPPDDDWGLELSIPPRGLLHRAPFDKRAEAQWAMRRRLQGELADVQP